MYESFYRLSNDPFGLTPDPRFCFAHKSYARARAYMQYALNKGEGLVVVTGRSGTGKTTLAEGLLSELDSAAIMGARLTGDALEAMDLLRKTAYAFGLDVEHLDKATLVHRIVQFLVRQERKRRRVLLIIDEAQTLSREALEGVRLLADLHGRSHPLIQVFLLGQERLQEVIRAHDMEHLQQRVIAACHLNPLDLRETRAYMEHRLHCVAWQGDPKVSGPAVLAIYQHSQGLPRQINKICGRLLLYGGAEEKHTLDKEDVLTVVGELRDELLMPLARDPTVFHEVNATATEQEAGSDSVADLALTAPVLVFDRAVAAVTIPRRPIPEITEPAGNQPTASTPRKHGHGDAPEKRIRYRTAYAHYGERRDARIARIKLRTKRVIAGLLKASGAIGRGGMKALVEWPLRGLSTSAAVVRSRGIEAVKRLAQQAPEVRARWRASLRSLTLAGQLSERARVVVGRVEPRVALFAVAGVLATAVLLAVALKTNTGATPDGSPAMLAARQGEALVSLRQEQDQPLPISPALPESAVAMPVGPAANEPVERRPEASPAAYVEERAVDTQPTAIVATAVPRGHDVGVDMGSFDETQDPGLRGGAVEPPAPSLEVVMASTHAVAVTSSPPTTVQPDGMPAETEPDGQTEASLVGEAVVFEPETATARFSTVSQGSPAAAVAEPATALLSRPEMATVASDEPGQVSADKDAEVSTRSQDERIGELLALARQALAEDRLLIPADNSAFDYYRRVLALDAGNRVAEEGLSRILARYTALAGRAINRQDYEKAHRYIARGLRVQPGDAGMLVLRERVIAAESARQAAALAQAPEPEGMTQPEEQSPAVEPKPKGFMGRLKRLFKAAEPVEPYPE